MILNVNEVILNFKFDSGVWQREDFSKVIVLTLRLQILSNVSVKANSLDPDQTAPLVWQK